MSLRPDSAVVDLANDLRAFAVAPAAHLLAALASQLPGGAVTLCVVDPGVGSARTPAAVHADRRWYLGPDNGLMSVVAARAAHARSYELEPLGNPISPSFEGRDFFAPHAARLLDASVGDRVRVMD
jgi:S-adenosyl-L-methionine hydrolase (adenosine-forming)